MFCVRSFVHPRQRKQVYVDIAFRVRTAATDVEIPAT